MNNEDYESKIIQILREVKHHTQAGNLAKATETSLKLNNVMTSYMKN